MPHTTHASAAAVPAAATAACHGGRRTTASRTARTTSGSAATSAEANTLPDDGIVDLLKDVGHGGHLLWRPILSGPSAQVNQRLTARLIG